MRRAAKSDGNQQQIMDGLREHYGDRISVYDTHKLGNGFGDIVTGIDGWLNMIFEIKTDSGRMTKDEMKFMYLWRGQYQVIRCLDQAICAIERALGFMK